MNKNPFPVPTPFEKILLEELTKVARSCYDRGWSWGTAGNFSMRGQQGILWQSPSGLCKGDLKAEFFIPVKLETEQALYPSLYKPSLEMPVHAGIYKEVSEAKCVVHTHPFSVVQMSCGRKKFEFQNEEMAKALGLTSHRETLMVPILSNVSPEEMTRYSPSVGQGILNPAKVLVLEGHGVWAWGKTPLEALGYIEALEFLCKKSNLPILTSLT